MPDTLKGVCGRCNRDTPAWLLYACPGCGTIVCARCAQFAHGRHFCSTGCAEFFFHGDPEEIEGEEG